MEKMKIGQLVNTHGIQGECKIRVSTEFVEERFAIGQMLMLEKGNQSKVVHVKSRRWHKDVLLVVFEEIADINAAEPYKGYDVMIDATDIEELEEGYYVFELIGFSVYDETKKFHGLVKDIEETLANDVLRIARDGQSDLLVPFVDAFVIDINKDDKTITIQWMEGLA